jgi:hypothetical protein
MQSAAVILRLIAPLFYSKRGWKRVRTVPRFSLITVRSDAFRTQYEELRDFLSENVVVAAQTIRGN